MRCFFTILARSLEYNQILSLLPVKLFSPARRWVYVAIYDFNRLSKSFAVHCIFRFFFLVFFRFFFLVFFRFFFLGFFQIFFSWFFFTISVSLKRRLQRHTKVAGFTGFPEKSPLTSEQANPNPREKLQANPNPTLTQP